ncbi:hypothetical protein XpopCFBP1817_08385 [Xanthomonas populi]|uniref:Uncharacterized protein n=1 Tax=Xanthomonas populi TaxID=53414 RepID=A0A2S7ER69_9XANT|nr:hypothetical protein XpopCFBP1817_08385 [Xanthomonas populi]
MTQQPQLLISAVLIPVSLSDDKASPARHSPAYRGAPARHTRAGARSGASTENTFAMGTLTP